VQFACGCTGVVAIHQHENFLIGHSAKEGILIFAFSLADLQGVMFSGNCKNKKGRRVLTKVAVVNNDILKIKQPKAEVVLTREGRYENQD
jgi:hypothetical protein